MRVKQKSAWYAACYGGSIKRVEKVLREDNPRVPARLVAKEFKKIRTLFRFWERLASRSLW